MTSLYAKDSVIGKLWNWFSMIFSEETRTVTRHLFELALSVLALDGFQSAKSNFERFISEISSCELKSFYYALNGSKISLPDWMGGLMKAALFADADADFLPLTIMACVGILRYRITNRKPFGRLETTVSVPKSALNVLSIF